MLLAGGAAAVAGQSALDSFDPNANGLVSAISVQADGKVLIGGSFTTVLGVARNRIARLNPDGTLDTAFNPSANGIVNTIAVQAGGKILVGGQFTTLSPNGGAAVTRNRIARLNADGTLDTAFDPNANAEIHAIAVQADGKILVGGTYAFTNIAGQTRNRIARLNADGTLDTAFDPNSNNQVRSITVQADGKILVGGDFSVASGTPTIGGQTRNFIARLDATTGLADSWNPDANNAVRSIAVQADSQIIAAGDFNGANSIGGQTRSSIARLDATTGLADSWNPNATSTVYSVAVQPDGKILAVGFFFGANSIGGQARDRIARLDATTGLADSFDPKANSTVRSVAIQSDGKILVGGSFTALAPNGGAAVTRNRIARLETDGTLDQTLGPGVTWLGGNGSWHDISKWTPSTVPNSANTDVIVDSASGTDSIVTIDVGSGGNTTIGRLRIDAGDRVELGFDETLNVNNSAFAGAGELLINGTLLLSPNNNALSGTMVINGTGKITLQGGPGAAEINGLITNNGTIEGAGSMGYPGNNQETHNNGTINANVAGGTLLLDSLGSNPHTNTGVMTATNGATLHMHDGTWNNAGGEIIADGPGSVFLFDYHARIEGGSLSAINGGLLRMGTNVVPWQNVTVSGPTEVNLGTIEIVETLTNNGVMTVSGFGRIQSPNVPHDPIVVSGSGEIVLDKPDVGTSPAFDDAYGKWLIQGQLIRGRGRVGAWSGGFDGMEIEFTNRGTFQADRNGEYLHIDVERFDNQSGGVLRAIDGGILLMDVRSPLLNTGGTIEALNGGRIEAGFARIEGGLVRNGRPYAVPPIPPGFLPIKGMKLVNPGTGMRLEGDLTLGAPSAGQEAWLINEIENTGTLRISSFGQYARLKIGEGASPTATLTGGGEIIMGDATNGSMESQIYEDSGSTVNFTNLNNTIRGFGKIGDFNLISFALSNAGTIKADVPGKMLLYRTRTTDNTGGFFRAENGGLLRLEAINGFDNVGGLVESLADSTVDLQWLTQFTGGTLRNNGGTFNVGYATLVNLTLQGPMHISNGLNARLVGDIINEGSVQSRSSGSDTKLFIGRSGAPNVHMTGGGELIVNDLAAGSDKGKIEEGTDSAFLYLDDQTLRGFGAVGGMNGGYRELNIVNNDLVNADVSGRTLALTTVTLLNSPGKVMKGSNGGNLSLDFIALTNTGASILAEADSQVTFGGDQNRRLIGGLVRSQVGGTLSLQEGVKAEGGVLFENLGTTIVGSAAGGERKLLGLDNGGSQFLNAGLLKKINSPEYHLHSPLTHTGSIVTEAGVLRMFGGGTVTNAGISTTAGAHTGFHGPQPYTFSGVNTFSGGGGHFTDGGSLLLADAATQLNATNFRFVNGSMTGPGTLSVSGQLAFNGYTTATISGAKIINLPGASGAVELSAKGIFASGARLENQGTLAMQGGSLLDGAADTLFTNTASGVLQSHSSLNEMRMPLHNNSGLIEVLSYRLSLTRNMTFANGRMSVANGSDARVLGINFSLQGTENLISGAGITLLENSAMVFDTGAKLTAGKLDIYGASSLSGAGEFNGTTDIRFLGYGTDVTINQTALRIAEDATGVLDIPQGNLRFNNNAVLENSGTFDFNEFLSIFTDGTGELRILEPGASTFNVTRTVPLKLHLEGSLYAANNRTVTFDRGGTFHNTAKVLPNGTGAQLVFTGTAPWITRGQAVEFAGTGYVKFKDTSLQFDDATPGDPSDDPDIDAGARVVFEGTNNVSGRGTLSTTGFVFNAGALTVDTVTLKTTGNVNDSVWSATDGTVTLQNGAKFLNDARFVIQAKVGSFSGSPTSLFHNMANGRVVHDTNTTTDLDVDFHNDGVLEFRSGTFNFLKKFTGTGGIAASNGAKVTLSLASTALNQLPSLLETLGAGSEINITLPSGQDISINMNLSGGKIVAAGGLNLVAAGGLNMVAAGGGNIVAAGGLNMVAAGAGNITANGLASLIQANGGNIVAAGGGNILSHNGGQIVAAGGGNILSHNGGQIVAAGGGNIVAAGGLNADGGLIEADGGEVRSNGAAGIVAAGGGNIVAAGGGNIVAAGGGNIVAAGGGNIVAAGGGNIVAAGGGNIVAAGGGNLMGAGSFSGPGVVQNGGAMRPGMSPGTLTWTGNLTVENGGLLDIEIAGTTAGTQYDVVNVSGAFAMNGTLRIQFLNSFGSNVQPTDVFDIATAGSPITSAITNLYNGRVFIFGTQGSFAVQLVNGGNTMRLTDYQYGPITFNSWASAHSLTGANASMTADIDNDGLTHLEEYAFGRDPNMADGGALTEPHIITDNGNNYLALSFSRPTGAEAPTDLTYTPERTTNLSAVPWSAADIVLQGILPGPGSLETVTVRSTHVIGETPAEFLHINVTLSSP